MAGLCVSMVPVATSMAWPLKIIMLPQTFVSAEVYSEIRIVSPC